jgi:hypothetical protein
MAEKSVVKEVADTDGVAEPEPDPEVVVVDDELLLPQAATNRPLATTIVANARFRVSLTLLPPSLDLRTAQSDPVDPIRDRRYNTMNIL